MMVGKKVKRGKQVKEGGNLLYTCCRGGGYDTRLLLPFLHFTTARAKTPRGLEPKLREQKRISYSAGGSSLSG